MCPLCDGDEGYGIDLLLVLVKDIFYAAATTCVLYAAHRAANGLLLGSRVAALRELEVAYTPEEREVLIHRIKRGSLRY